MEDEVKLPDVSNLTVDQLLELVKAIAPKIKEAGKLAELLGAGEGEAKTEEEVKVETSDEDEEKVEAEVKTEDSDAVKVEDEDDEEKRIAVEDAAMKRAFKALSNRDAMARKAGAVVGVFDASNMTERECAAYVLKKVGLTAAKGHEVTAANAYLAGVNKAKPAQAVATTDAADPKPSAVPSFLSKQMGA